MPHSQEIHDLPTYTMIISHLQGFLRCQMGLSDLSLWISKYFFPIITLSQAESRGRIVKRYLLNLTWSCRRWPLLGIHLFYAF